MSSALTRDGELAPAFREDLRKTAATEMHAFDQRMKNARPADQDLFGIKRRLCEVRDCESCTGYEPTKVLFGGRGEFPTFCKHCNCPAHFHTVEEEE